jgi:hypothetical protein
MDKVYQVFVSSTYSDLQDERREVSDTLAKGGFIPTGMELFPATDQSDTKKSGHLHPSRESRAINSPCR